MAYVNENKQGSAESRKNPKRVATTGAQIMEIAEMLRPSLMKRLEGCRDENGMPVAPARIRGIALIIAQHLVKNQAA